MFKSVKLKATKAKEKVEKQDASAGQVQDELSSYTKQSNFEGMAWRSRRGEKQNHSPTDYVDSAHSKSVITVREHAKWPDSDDDTNDDLYTLATSISSHSFESVRGDSSVTPPADLERPFQIRLGANMDDSLYRLQKSSEAGGPQGSPRLHSERPPARSHRRSSSMNPNIEKQVGKEAITWEQIARKANSEVDRLKQQLAREIKCVSELTIELSALRSELESTRVEADHLRSFKQASEERENGQMKAHLEMEDARQTIKELKEELAYEKSVSLSLDLQLQKTNESNSQLLLEIQDLQEAMRKLDKELKDSRTDHPASKDQKQPNCLEKESIIQRVHQSEEKHQRVERSTSSLQEIWNKELLEDTIDEQKKHLTELEKELQELTEENLNLLIQMKEATDKINNQNNLIDQLESKLESSTNEVSISSDWHCSLNTQELNLEAILKTLREKVEFSVGGSDPDSRTLLNNIRQSIMSLCSTNKHLQAQLNALKEENSSLEKEVDAMRESIINDKGSTVLASQKGQLKILREKIRKITADYEDAMKRSEDLQIENSNLRHTLIDACKALQQQLRNKENSVSTDGAYTKLWERDPEIQTEFAKLEEQLSLLIIDKGRTDTLEKFNNELQEQIQQAEATASTAAQELHACKCELETLMVELHANLGQLKDTQERLLSVEGTKEEMANKLKDVEQESKLQNSHIKDLETQLSSLKQENECLNRSVSASECSVMELQKKKAELQHALAESEKAAEKSESMSAEIESLNAEIHHLQVVVQNLKMENNHQDKIIKELKLRCLKAQEETEAATSELEEVRIHKRELESTLQIIKNKQEEAFSSSQLQMASIQEENAECKKVIYKLLTSLQNIKTLTGSKKDERATSANLTWEDTQLSADLAEMHEMLLDLANNGNNNPVQLSLEAQNLGRQTFEQLRETLQRMSELQNEQIVQDQKIAVLQDQISLLEREKCKLVEENENATRHLQQYENLHAELENSRNVLHEMELERIHLESSLQETSLKNGQLVEEISKLKDKTKTSDEDADEKPESKGSRSQPQKGKARKGAFELEQRNETRLRKQVAELKHKLLQQEEGRDEMRKRILFLEEELQQKAGLQSPTEKNLKDKKEEKHSNGSGHSSTLSKSLSRGASKVRPMLTNLTRTEDEELAELRNKVKFLEGELKHKSVELEAVKYVFRQKEAEHFQLEKENHTTPFNDSRLEGLQNELHRLQDQNEALNQREHELLSRIGSQEALQNEVERLQKDKQDLESKLSSSPMEGIEESLLKKVRNLEIELAEASEANNMYKSQLQSVVGELAWLRARSIELEEELRDIQDRYSQMSLRFAEVEAEREELVLALRTNKT